MDLDLAQLRALSATVSEGTLEAAARSLHITPSAVSQRLRALEVATGRVLLVRSRPVRPTESGEVLLRLARQIDLLAGDAVAELGVAAADDRIVTLPIAVNADSLATWALPALAELAGDVALELHRDDEEHTAALLRSGAVVAAVTTDPDPVPGCSVTRLGVMRYRPTASPTFARRWFPGGVTAEALARAPVVVFDRKDDLQHRYLRERLSEPVSPPTHGVPASAEFLTAVRLGMGWGMLPDLQAAAARDAGDLVDLDPAGAVDVVLHWQQWKLRSARLDRVGAALATAARAQLLR
ncbi:LysR family transcriptional regulator ArgP [Actinotalea sp. Marseille-Q4924]|uniref:LysR family transcriptional regulator ArgP n=1 Tax=Actinotalea sp. Marseille-Q4924 TaxID=2866571 RepID=UPI001CE3E073|nr:LysR family transcriptional regulator ArgP [Actinotalea sp. Marseille-Q4924]